MHVVATTEGYCDISSVAVFYQIDTGSLHVSMLSGAACLIVLDHLGTVVRMAGDSWVTGLIHLGDVVCMGDRPMVFSALYPWSVIRMGDA